jgi:hypothetical protein
LLSRADVGQPGDPATPMHTSPDAHDLQHEIYVRMGGAGRLSIAFGLAEAMRQAEESMPQLDAI